MNADVMFRIVVFGLAAFLAVLVTRRVSPPKPSWIWWVLLVVLVVAPYIGTNVKLVAFSGFAIRLNDIIQGFVFGLLAGWLSRKRR